MKALNKEIYHPVENKAIVLFAYVLKTNIVAEINCNCVPFLGNSIS